VFDVFAPSYHWSFMQVEYATDLHGITRGEPGVLEF
jgi:hypothetical protein